MLASASALARGEITGEHVPKDVVHGSRQRPVVSASTPDIELRDELTRLLNTNAGNVSAVARDMGKARVQIRRWCRRFGIDVAAFRP